MTLRFSRRRLLSLATALLTIAFPWAARTQSAHRNFFGNFRVDARTLEQFVGTYLGEHPEEADADRLEQLLFADRLPGSTIGEDKLGIVDMIEKDFETDDTVIADGWILSRTEVRLWAWMYELSV